MSQEHQAPPAFPQARKKKLGERTRIWLVGVFGFIAIGFISIHVAGYIGYHDGRKGIDFIDGFGPWVFGATGFLLVAAVMLWSLKYWKSIDEMARRAHLDSWYWGGVLGGTPCLMLGALVMGIPDIKFAPLEQMAVSSTHAFGLGAVALYTTMLLGYVGFWLLWWVKKR